MDDRHLVLVAWEFVRDRLGDPGLSPSTVAAHCRVSLRSLQLAFADAGSSPAATIRAERMRAAIALLGNPRHRSLPVGQIAHRVGFADPTVFIRAFKRELGTTPGAWRADTYRAPDRPDA